MNINDKIKIQRIDACTVDVNGQRLSTKEALEYLKDLAQEFDAKLYTEEDLDEIKEGQWDEVYEQVKEDVFDSIKDQIQEESYAQGHDDALAENVNDKKSFSCARCNQKLSKEHIERLSNINKPRLNEFDHCKLIFDISDYNESCKK